MGKLFLYGRTVEEDITDLFAKLTVYCSAGTAVRVLSVDSSTVFESTSNINGEVVFNNITPGYWDVTVVGVENAPVKRIKIDSLEYVLTLTQFSATIKVSYPAGSVCVVSKGTETYTSPDTSGIWSCDVLSEGEWTVTCTNGDQNESTTVDITYDGQSVSVVLKYFTSMIHVTYPVGTNCTVYNDTKTYVDPNASGEWTCVVPNTGTWFVTVTGNGINKTETVNIIEDGQVIDVEFVFMAYITVAYPVGANCTIYNGTKTYVAPDTSGEWTCVVPNIGTWFVTVTGNGVNKTETVNIIEDSQVINVDLIFRAYITVIYPKRSTCSLEYVPSGTDNREYSENDPDNNGEHTFTIPWVGEWEIKCKDTSGHIASERVRITSEKQQENIELTYRTYTYLYHYGDLCTDVTGGWKRNEPYEDLTYFTIDNDGIHFYHNDDCDADYGSWIATDNEIRLDDYHNYAALINIHSYDTSCNYAPVVAISIYDWNDNQIGYKEYEVSEQEQILCELDITHVTGLNYVCVEAYQCSGEVLEVYLE